MSELGAPRSNWAVLLNELQGDDFLVIANRMNPRNGGMIQNRDRLYQVWYHHGNAKRHDKNVIADGLVQFRAMDCDNLMTHLDNSMGLALRLHHFILPSYDSRVTLDAGRLSGELKAKKSKKESKAAASKGTPSSQRTKIDEEDEEEEGSNKKQLKWHSVHEQLWKKCFTATLQSIQNSARSAGLCRQPKASLLHTKGTRGTRAWLCATGTLFG